MSDGNYIKINRKMLEWEWYKNEHTKSLFIHCLLKANWKDGKFQGMELKRGQFATSIPKLGFELELTSNEVRTAIKHLKSTGEITVRSYSKFSVITVVKYDLYQDKSQSQAQWYDSQNTSTSQSINSLLTTIEEGKKERKKKGKKVNNIMVSKDTICPEVEESAPDSMRILLPLVDGSFYEVPDEKIQNWAAAFPSVDILLELKKMYVWLDGNPKKKKTRRGIGRFIVGWLERAQNKGGCGSGKKTNSDFIEELKGWAQNE